MLSWFISKLNPHNSIRIVDCPEVSPLFGFIKLGENEKEESKGFESLIVLLCQACFLSSTSPSQMRKYFYLWVN